MKGREHRALTRLLLGEDGWRVHRDLDRLYPILRRAHRPPTHNLAYIALRFEGRDVPVALLHLMQDYSPRLFDGLRRLAKLLTLV